MSPLWNNRDRIKNFDFELSTRDRDLAVIQLEYPIAPAENMNLTTPTLARMSLNCHRRPRPYLVIEPPSNPSVDLRRLELQGFSLHSNNLNAALSKLTNLEHLVLLSILINVEWDHVDLMRSARNFETFKISLPLWGNRFQTAALCPKLLQLDFDRLGYNPNRVSWKYSLLVHFKIYWLQSCTHHSVPTNHLPIFW